MRLFWTGRVALKAPGAHVEVQHTVGEKQLMDPIPAATTVLIVQVETDSLPNKLVSSICQLKHIQELDLSGCRNLQVLPAAFKACGLGRRLQQLQLPPSMMAAVRASAKGTSDLKPGQKLAAILRRQQRRQAILKLSTEQEPMLTTLERISWLLIILATITLTAFLQPGMEGVAAGNAAKLDTENCLNDVNAKGQQLAKWIVKNMANESVPKMPSEAQNETTSNLFHSMQNPFEQLPARSQVLFFCCCVAKDGAVQESLLRFLKPHCGNYSVLLPPSFSDTTTCGELKASMEKCYEDQQKAQRGGWYLFFTVLSFCVTLLCLLLIVVVSLPRLKCTNLAYEAGRLWLFLLIIWLLFTEAVQLSFLSFWFYAVLVYDPTISFLFDWQYRDALHWGLADSASYGHSIWRMLDYSNLASEGPYISLFDAAGVSGVTWSILCTISATVPVLIVVIVYFAQIYPGHRAVHLACCSCTCIGPTQDFVDSYSNREVQEDELGLYVSACAPTVIKVE